MNLSKDCFQLFRAQDFIRQDFAAGLPFNKCQQPIKFMIAIEWLQFFPLSSSQRIEVVKSNFSGLQI